tara:strand:- start:14639 stop:15943 length:1305 start_codon:yes stop_codon:yes gene_type:complete
MLTKKKLSKRRVTTAVSSFLLLIFIIGCGSQEELSGDRNLIPDNNQTESHYNTANETTNSNNKISSNAKDVSQLEETPVIPVGTSEWRRTNFRKFLADLDIEEISSGSVGRDGIPPIYNPLFISIQEAEEIEWLTGDHPVAIVEMDGNVKAYPLGILTFHEVVNDTIGDTPVVLTYCPLCYTAIGFIREVNGTVLNFGTTGNLRRSNLIMWDDVTESWWQQITGQAIIGDLAGESLDTVSVNISSFDEYKRSYPKGLVLSPDSTNYDMDEIYGKNPYVRYDAPNTQPFMFKQYIDKRLDPVERVLGININEDFLAIPFTSLEESLVRELEHKGEEMVVFYNDRTLSALDKELIVESRIAGSASVFFPYINGEKIYFYNDNGVITDKGTNSKWSQLGQAYEGPLMGETLDTIEATNILWFAWASFHPETGIAFIK